MIRSAADARSEVGQPPHLFTQLAEPLVGCLGKVIAQLSNLILFHSSSLLVSRTTVETESTESMPLSRVTSTMVRRQPRASSSSVVFNIPKTHLNGNKGYLGGASSLRAMPKASPKPSSIHRPEHAVLAQLLRELRLAAGLTQAEAAERLGLTQTSISDFETSDRGLELLVVRDLVRIYDADWLSFVDELERRLLAEPKPASSLIRKQNALRKRK
jgi:DNA-binding XRE family transcriptional regulator